MCKKHAKKYLNDFRLVKKISCFLCSEDTTEKCHRRLVAEMLNEGFEIVHL